MLVFYEYFWWVSNGSLNLTESNDSLSASAQVRVTGSLGVTEAADTLSSAAQAIIHGAASNTEAADTLASSGTNLNHAAANAIESADSISSGGVVVVHGVAVPVDIDTVLAAAHNAAVAEVRLRLVHFYRVVTPPTFYLLQEDGVGRIITENGGGFLELESGP